MKATSNVEHSILNLCKKASGAIDQGGKSETFWSRLESSQLIQYSSRLSLSIFTLLLLGSSVLGQEDTEIVKDLTFEWTDDNDLELHWQSEMNINAKYYLIEGIDKEGSKKILSRVEAERASQWPIEYELSLTSVAEFEHIQFHLFYMGMNYESFQVDLPKKCEPKICQQTLSEL